MIRKLNFKLIHTIPIRSSTSHTYANGYKTILQYGIVQHDPTTSKIKYHQRNSSTTSQQKLSMHYGKSLLKLLAKQSISVLLHFCTNPRDRLTPYFRSGNLKNSETKKQHLQQSFINRNIAFVRVTGTFLSYCHTMRKSMVIQRYK